MSTTAMKSFLPVRARRVHGLSLIELMISITLGMLIVAALLALYLNVSRTNNEMEKMNRQIENGRFAIQLLQSDLMHAGFWGGFLPQFEDRGVAAPGDAPVAVPDPCVAPAGTADLSNLIGIPVQGEVGSCAVVAGQKANTDILVVRHAETSVGMVACPAGEVCFQVSQCDLEISASPPQSYVFATTGHTLHKKDCVGTGSPVMLPITAGSTAVMRKFISNIYYIRNDATLMRSEFLNGVHQAAQPMVDGIEGFRVEYGIDDVGKNGAAVSYVGAVNRGDGVVDNFISCAPCTAQQLANVVAVRIHVLARSSAPTQGYTDTKTYTLGGTTMGPFVDGYKRHVFTTTVRLTNPAGRRETQ